MLAPSAVDVTEHEGQVNNVDADTILEVPPESLHCVVE